MSDAFKTRLISVGNTFVSSFLLAIATSLTQIGQIEWTTSFWIAIAISAARFAVAEVLKSFTPVHLGGRRVK